MLETFGIVITQVAMLFILIAVGFFLCKKDILNDTVRKGVTVILLDIVTPCVVIAEMQTERTTERMTGLLVTAAVSALYFIIFILLSALLTLRHKNDNPRRASEQICSIYSNCGFMGLPLLASLSSIVGNDALFYGSVIIGMYNLFIFTHGIALFRGEDKAESAKKKILSTAKMLITPAVIAIFIGAALFFMNFSLPSVIGRPIEYIASMNTPLAMLVIGAIICNSNVLEIFRDKRIYFPVILKNLVYPLLFLGICFILTLINVPSHALLICAIIMSCPVAGNCAIFSERYEGDSKLASGAFSLSTLVSIITIPLIVTLATSIL